MICDRKVWTLFGPSTTDSCQKTTRRYGVCVVVINNDTTVYCNIDWFHLACSFYASIFYPFCEQHGLETTLFPEKIEGWSWAINARPSQQKEMYDFRYAGVTAGEVFALREIKISLKNCNSIHSRVLLTKVGTDTMLKSPERSKRSPVTSP